jgi:hypothetical protein
MATKSRLTTVTGKTRDEAAREARALRHQTQFPALRSVNEAARHAALPDSPSGMVGASQTRAAVQDAVAAAVQATHDHYRRLLGESRFNALHGVSGEESAAEVERRLAAGWTPTDDAEPATTAPAGGRGDGQPRFVGPNVEPDHEHGLRRIGTRVADSVTGDELPAAGTIIQPGDADPRPIGVVTKVNAPTLHRSPLEVLEGDRVALDDSLAMNAMGEMVPRTAVDADQSGAEPFHHPHDRDDDDQNGSQSAGGLLGKVVGAIKGANEPAGGKAGAGTPRGGSGKEDPPQTTFPCEECAAAGQEFVAGSEAGLKAHKRAKHKGA